MTASRFLVRTADSAAQAAAVLLVGTLVQSPIPNTLPACTGSQNQGAPSPSDDQLTIFVVLESVLVDVYPATSITDSLTFHHIQWPHRRCGMHEVKLQWEA